MNILLARQPIFHNNAIAGYELLRRNIDQPGTDEPSEEQALVDLFLGPGTTSITSGLPAFVGVTWEVLLSNALLVLSPQTLIPQVSLPDGDDPELLRACEHLALSGFRIALDHFTFSEHARPFLELGPIVKLDLFEHPGDQLDRQVELLRDYPALLLAEKVENRAAHTRCVGLGFEFFQGYHFSRPETFSRKDLSVDHMRVFRLMRLVRDPNSTDSAIEEAFRGDVALTYKLLRMVNSAASGARGVRSISHALRLLGREALNRWLALMLLSPARRSDIDAAIVHATLLRARFCELLADAGSRPLSSGTSFMLGLLAAFQSTIGIPVDDITEGLDMVPELNAALRARRGHYGCMLALAEAYEDGRWDDASNLCTEFGVAPIDVARHYLDAMGWATERVQSDFAGDGTVDV